MDRVQVGVGEAGEVCSRRQLRESIEAPSRHSVTPVEEGRVKDTPRVLPYIHADMVKVLYRWWRSLLCLVGGCDADV